MSLKQVTYVYTVETEVHPVPITKCPLVPACEAAPCIEFHELPILGCDCEACEQVVLKIKDSAIVLPPCDGVIQKGILARIVFKEQILDENDCPTNEYRVIFEYDDAALVTPESPLQSCDIDSYSCLTSSDSYILRLLDCGGDSEFSFLVDGDSGPVQTVNGGETLLILGGTNCTTVASAPNTITIDVDTLPSYSFIIDGDSGPAQTIADGNTVLILGGEGCATVASATDTITINVDPVSTDVGNLITNGADNQAFIDCAAIAACAGEAFSFELDASSGTAETIASGDTLTIAQGDGITTVVAATGTVTVSARLSATAGNILVIDSTALYVPTPAFTLAGDSGASQTISNGNTLTVVGGTHCASATSATDTVTINVENQVSADADNILVLGADNKVYLDCVTVAACISIDATQSITSVFGTVNTALAVSFAGTLFPEILSSANTAYPPTGFVPYEATAPFNGAVTSISINTGLTAATMIAAGLSFEIKINGITVDTISNSFTVGNPGVRDSYQSAVSGATATAGDQISIKLSRTDGAESLTSTILVSLVYVEI